MDHFFWQDDGWYNLELILWPPVGLFVAYYVYCKIVVADIKTVDLVYAQTIQSSPSIPNESKKNVKPLKSEWNVFWIAAILASAATLVFFVIQVAHKKSEKLPEKYKVQPINSADSEKITPKYGEIKETQSSAVYKNSRFGFIVRYPKNTLFPQGESDNGDGQVFVSGDGTFFLTVWGEINANNNSIKDMFEYESRGLVGQNKKMVVTYKRLKNNWFVVSGTEDSVGIYRRVHVNSNHIARIEMRWPNNHVDRWRSTIEKISISDYNEDK